MNRRTCPLRLLVVLLAVASVPLSAIVISVFSAVVDFTSAAASAAAWSPTLERTPHGLTAANGREFWVQLPPVAVGSPDRPPRSASVEAVVTYDGACSNLDLSVRYSADHVHWSSWHDLQATWKDPYDPRGVFQGEVSVPTTAGKTYEVLREEWWKTNPPWPNDEHEFCVWLAANRPAYFATEIPLIGYLQLRLLGVPRENFRLANVKLSGTFAVSGINFFESARPRPGSDGKWFFDLSAIRQPIK